ncbi:MAG: toprim domain-containing protein [Candidatus Lokiarchaeota archaeon]|nr:toprim domain-containing protein [Candidatus Lokiarchaeota archaeon]
MAGKKRFTHLPSQKWTEKMVGILKDLIMAANSGTAIIVEGKKDEAALRSLGTKGKIHCIHNRGYRLFEFAEQIAPYKRVILLTDFDHQGEKTLKELRNYLETKRCKVDVTFWNRMKLLFRRLTKDIESLDSVISRLQLESFMPRDD